MTVLVSLSFLLFLADGSTGLCKCFDDFFSGDGFGKAGRRGDCGASTLSGMVRISATP